CVSDLLPSRVIFVHKGHILILTRTIAEQLFVGQLDSCVTDEDLDKAFSPYGELTVKVIE
uniref:RRM domain-containing protein n=1 Tax=Aegilops tauschii subsp. strangulata TaxID=200361 RepID=A0A453BQN5_AEGTS